MKKLYDKSKLWFAIIWITVYCVLMSVGDALSEAVGTQKLITLPIALMLSTILIVFLLRNKLLDTYGLCRSKTPAGKMLYYLPILLMLTANLWYGMNLNCSVVETVLYILTMFFVGFLEEVIFRGLLFNAMRKDNVKAAIIVSSITFGIGHIINLFNGSGAELLPNLLQVIYATAAGFMFVMIYYKTESLLVCIGAHGLFNALSVFSNESVQTVQTRILSCVLLTVITGTYAVYLALMKKNEYKNII